MSETEKKEATKEEAYAAALEEVKMLEEAGHAMDAEAEKFKIVRRELARKIEEATTNAEALRPANPISPTKIG